MRKGLVPGEQVITITRPQPRKLAGPDAAFIAAPAAEAFASAWTVRGEASLNVSGGYARLVLKLAEDVESEVSMAGTILVIRFKKPVDIPVESLSDAAPDYVGSARRDPDGSAIRLALSRTVTLNSMVAGEQILTDLFPEQCAGRPPGSPAGAARDRSDRSRDA